MVVTEGWEEGGRSYCLTGAELLLGMMKKFWVWWLHNTVNILNTTELYIRKWLNDNYDVMHILPQLEGNTNAEH